ncbi:MAG TPA: sialate O-acetylesterase [Capsulimonadaceae bacterium]|jgi:sialate O-acetylesterase
MHNCTFRRFIAAVVFSLTLVPLLAAPSARAADAPLPFLSPVFGDNMVLQRDTKDRIWGWTTPGEAVVVTLAGKAYTTKADNSGKWMATTDPLPAGGPYTVEIHGSQTKTLTNVMMGDVWICSGQSNMEQGIGIAANPTVEIAAADYPNIRLYRVPHVIAGKPQVTLAPQQDKNWCAWQPCSPTTIATPGWGGFSAAAYFFGRRLYKELNVPIGLITDPWGGMPAESFVSGDKLRNLPDFKGVVEALDSGVDPAVARKEYAIKLAEWSSRNEPGTAAKVAWSSPTLDDSSWKTIKVGTSWENAGIPELANFDGILWYRVAFDAPAAWAGRDLTLSLGPIDDNDTTFVNGAQVGSTEGWDKPRVYTVPGTSVKAGRNTIAVLVLDSGGGGGLYGKPADIFVALKGDTTSKIALDTAAWKYKVGSTISAVPTPPAIADPTKPNTATVLYNGMVAPLVPMAIKGAIWYQGESNGGRGYQYRALMPALIEDWRDKFKSGEFPFFLVQLANWKKSSTSLLDTSWAEVREAQLMTTQRLPKVGMAVAIDIGDPEDIHPKDKQSVGERLALNALAIAYGKKIEYSGPIYKSMKVDGSSIRVSFTHADSLVAKGGKLTGFAICGPDRVFVPAEATIDGNTVVVHADSIAVPVAARYAFEIYPEANLYNQANLPASPFRTDTWPLASQH